MNEYPAGESHAFANAPVAGPGPSLNVFDKICCVLAAIIGAIFIILGAVGFFLGSNAHFTLPPILGGLPLFLGWGIVKPIYVAWKRS